MDKPNKENHKNEERRKSKIVEFCNKIYSTKLLPSI